MTIYGGLGGIPGGRVINHEDRFESTVERLFGPLIRASNDAASEMWSALANVDWRHTDGDEAGYSFRAAGDLVAAVRGSGEYMDWYCSGPYAVVADWIEEGLSSEGWTYEAL